MHEYAWSVAGRMYWNVRNSLGQFCKRDGTNRSARAYQLRCWREYLAARRERAEANTRGHLVKPAFWGRVDVSRMFSPGASLRAASDELIEWFGSNGPTLSFAQFCAQMGA